MKIHGTKKLLDIISFEPIAKDSEEEENSLFSWHANLLVINRRKTLVLMNDNNRYVVVLHGLKAKDLKKLDVLIIEAIRELLTAERIHEDVIDLYLNKAGPVTFHKTKNRSMVARLNQSCDSVLMYARELEPSTLINTYVGKQASRFGVGGGKLPYTHPYEELFNDLAELTNGPIFKKEVAIMHISMSLEGHSIWRRVLVPLNLLFSEFHEVLQLLFDWKDSHMHEYYLYDETQIVETKAINSQSYTSRNHPAVLNIVMDEESFGYEQIVEMKMEKRLLLSDFIPPHRYMKYVYDFGDNWAHEIVIEEIVEDGSIQSPVILEGEGTAPPEDCGGEGGFNEFLIVMDDPKHPDHQFMKNWSMGQLHSEFDLEFVNRRLKGL